VSALDIENQRIIDECIAQNAVSTPRVWRAKPISDAGRHAEMVEQFDHGLKAKP